MWTASSEFGTYRLCEQRRFRRACASAQSRQNLRCSLIQAVSQEEICHDGMLEDTNSLDGAHVILKHQPIRVIWHLNGLMHSLYLKPGQIRFGVSQRPLRKPLAICKHHFAFSQVTPVGVPLSATRYEGIKSQCPQPFGQSPQCCCSQFTVKFLNIRTPEKLLLLFQNLNNVSLPQRNESKRCRWNCEQCRPWSDCSSRSSLIWVYTVCPGLPVWKLRIITWRQSQSFCKTCIYHNDPEFPGRQVWTV